jgi:putative endopeptidase
MKKTNPFRHALTVALIVMSAHAGSATGTTPPPGIARNDDASKHGTLAGINLQYTDPGIRAQDDFYDHVNGKWLRGAAIPADQSNWNIFTILPERLLPRLRDLIQNAAASHAANGTDAQRIADFYASFMDARVDDRGIDPLKSELDRIDQIKTKSELPALLAHLSTIGVVVPYQLKIHLDEKDSTAYIADITQKGLGMPDRDYYLQKDDAKLSRMKIKYVEHLRDILVLDGDSDAAVHAQAVVAMETALAQAQWTRVDMRDSLKSYNKYTLAGLATLAPGYDWAAWAKATGIDASATHIMVSQPSYLKAFAGIAASTPLDTWKAYLSTHLIDAYAGYLSNKFVDEQFAFYKRTLNDQIEQEPRWKRAVNTVDQGLGDALGKLYVEAYFPPESKARMEALVRNLLAAYKASIAELDWMSPATKKEAQAKLAKLTVKIGYPNKWRDYSALLIKPDDLVGNVMRARVFEFNRQVAKLGKPVDRDEWLMTPQRADAYNEAELNEIAFPAGILQPPFFDPQADDAVNYGSIGSTIGHEISHGFDDQGAHYDGDGNLRDWWTEEDHKRFDAKTRALVKQYSAFEPLKGYRVNGELTLGENIADNSGVAIAYKAYQYSLNGKKSPIIDRLTGEQRFFMGWAQVLRGKARDAYQIFLLKIDEHSPVKYRVDGVLRNQPGFYDAFNVKPGDKMYLPPAARVIIW